MIDFLPALDLHNTSTLDTKFIIYINIVDRRYHEIETVTSSTNLLTDRTIFYITNSYNVYGRINQRLQHPPRSGQAHLLRCVRCGQAHRSPCGQAQACSGQAQACSTVQSACPSLKSRSASDRPKESQGLPDRKPAILRPSQERVQLRHRQSS